MAEPGQLKSLGTDAFVAFESYCMQKCVAFVSN